MPKSPTATHLRRSRRLRTGEMLCQLQVSPTVSSTPVNTAAPNHLPTVPPLAPPVPVKIDRLSTPPPAPRLPLMLQGLPQGSSLDLEVEKRQHHIEMLNVKIAHRKELIALQEVIQQQYQRAKDVFIPALKEANDLRGTISEMEALMNDVRSYCLGNIDSDRSP